MQTEAGLVVAFAAAITIGACVGPPPKRQTEPPAQLHTLADGRTIMVVVAPATRAASASPEALRRYMETTFWPIGTRATIDSRKNLAYGFMTMFTVIAPGTQHSPVRELYVIRERANEPMRCTAKPVLDEAMGQGAFALCKTLLP